MELPKEIVRDFGGKRYQYYDIGRGPLTVIVLHGIVSTKNWSIRPIRYLYDKYRCIALDLPGHGGISLDGFSNIEDVGRYVRQFVHHLSLTNVVIFGYSLGGMVAYSVEKLFRGEPWLKGIIVWASPMTGVSGLTKQARILFTGMRMPTAIGATLKSQAMLGALTKLIGVPFSKEERQAISEFPIKTLSAWAPMIMEASNDVCPLVPGLYLYDPYDVLVSEKNLEYIKNRKNENCTVEVIPEGGHFGPERVQRLVLSECATFLKGLEKTR